jgi:hypothetical protein
MSKYSQFFWEVLYCESSTLSCSSQYCLLVNGISRTFIYILSSGNMKFYISWYSRADGQIRIWRQLCIEDVQSLPTGLCSCAVTVMQYVAEMNSTGQIIVGRKSGWLTLKCFKGCCLDFSSSWLFFELFVCSWTWVLPLLWCSLLSGVQFHGRVSS